MKKRLKQAAAVTLAVLVAFCASGGTAAMMTQANASTKTKYVVKLKTPKVSIKKKSWTNKFTLKWKKISGAKKYRIYRSYKKSSGYKRIKTTTSTSYTKTITKTSYFKVKAIGKTVGRRTYVSKSSSYDKATYMDYSNVAVSDDTPESAVTGTVDPSKIDGYVSDVSGLVLSDGTVIKKGETYDASVFGDTLSGRKIKITYMYADSSYCCGITGTDVETGGRYTLAVPSKGDEEGFYTGRINDGKYPAGLMEYDAVSTYGPEEMDLTKDDIYDHVDIMDDGDLSKQFKIFDKDVVVYENTYEEGESGTITAPTPDNYEVKLTYKEDEAFQQTTPWLRNDGENHNGYDWIRVYKGDEIIYEIIRTL